MSDLTRYSGGGTVDARTGTPTGRRGSGGSASTADVDFSVEVMRWGAMPPQVRALDTGRGDLVAECVVTLQGQARRIAGVLHQERVAVRAYRQRLIVASVVRPLGVRADGRAHPVGAWTLHEGTVHRPTAASVWQTEPGKGIRPGPQLAATRSAGGGGAAVSRSQQSGADTSLYLPATIRDRMNLEVPDPTMWLGTMIQWHTPGGEAVRQEVVVLRMNAGRAVVVAADRGRGRDASTGYAASEMAARPWRVTRVKYELGGQEHGALPAGGGHRQISR